MSDENRYPNLSAETLMTVDLFAQTMKDKLQVHHEKGQRGTWLMNDIDSLFYHARDELVELYEAVHVLEAASYTGDLDMRESSAASVISEAADLANMAMMVADKAREVIAECQIIRQNRTKKQQMNK